jgi:hypothetical protein
MKSISNSHALGQSLDNVFHNTSDGSRKITQKLSGNNLTITFQTIAQFGREVGLHLQTSKVKEEGIQLINDRLALLKSSFKELTGHTLKSKQCGINDSFETISVSNLSPRRVIKYSLQVLFEIED